MRQSDAADRSTSWQDARSLVTHSFPGLEALIEDAYRTSPSFRDLCQDYRNCTLALERWRRQSGDEPSQRAKEYAELLAELTVEVRSWLDELQNGAAKSRPRGDR